MQIRADKRLGLNADNLPDGTLCPVAGTVFDLRTRRPLSQGFMSEAAQQQAKGFDHAFVPDPALCDGKQIIAAYWSPAGDVCLEVATTMPCIQLYTGNYLGGQPENTAIIRIMPGWRWKPSISRTGRITRTGRMRSKAFQQRGNSGRV